MKKIIFITLCLLLVCILNAQTTSTFVDVRDSMVYKTVKIGEQTWMAQNLAYLPKVGGKSGIYIYNYTGTDVVAAKLKTNYKTYGVLYNFENAKTACPSGWHLPSNDEWSVMFKTLDFQQGQILGGIFLKEAGTSHWTSNPNNVTNSTGFTALPGGMLSANDAKLTDAEFNCINTRASFWSSTFSTVSTFTYVDTYTILNSLAGVSTDNTPSYYCYSIRCIKD